MEVDGAARAKARAVTATGIGCIALLGSFSVLIASYLLNNVMHEAAKNYRSTNQIECPTEKETPDKNAPRARPFCRVSDVKISEHPIVAASQDRSAFGLDLNFPWALPSASVGIAGDNGRFRSR